MPPSEVKFIITWLTRPSNNVLVINQVPGTNFSASAIFLCPPHPHQVPANHTAPLLIPTLLARLASEIPGKL
jgi:hypothetical protein